MMDQYRDDQSTLRSSGSGSGSRSGIPDDDMEEKENLLESGIRTHFPPPQKSQKMRRSKLAILSLPCTTFFLALSNVLLLAALVAVTLRPITTMTTTTRTSPAGATSGTEQANKFPEQPPWEPQVDFRTEIFRFQTIYGAEPSEEVDQAWTAMIPSRLLLSLPAQSLRLWQMRKWLTR